MSSTNKEQEIAPDPKLAAALRDAGGEPPPDVDWEALRGSIQARAELPLARRRQLGARRARVRVLLPLTAAASIAVAVWAGWQGEAAAPGPMAEWESRAQEALGAELSEHEFHTLVSGRAHAEELLLLAVGDR